MPFRPADLDLAIVRGEIAAWFQPQRDLTTEIVVGLEALCRWRHPELGDIPPVDFITVAEETGAIHELGRFMADAAMRAALAWARPGTTALSVSVNVSPLQLDTADFTDWLIAEIDVRRLRRGALTIEITESRPVSDVPAVVRRLDELREAGIGIAIDDFGTGQASLTQLKRLHATELKVDRSLMQDESPETDRLVAEAVRIGHQLGIVIVAEGIETPQQLDRARRLGCDRAQGYLLGRPMPEDQVAAALVG